MGYANYIGRVGGLAVALGVGMAVASTTGVAWADTTDAGNASADSASAPTRGSAKAARSAQASTPNAAASRSGRAAGDSATRSRGDSESPTRVKVRNKSFSGGLTSTAPAVAPDAPAFTPVAPAEGPTVVVADAPAAAAVRAPFAAATVAPTVVGNASPAPAAAVPAPIKNAIAAGATKWVKSILGQLVSGLGDQTQLTSLWAALALVRKELGKIGSLHLPTAAVTSSATPSPNLLVNSGAEFGNPTPSGFTSVTVPGWDLTGTPTVINYGGPRTIWSVGQPFAFPNLPAAIGFPMAKVGPKVNGTLTGGNQFFGGGPVADSSISQKVDLSGASAQIDLGTVGYNLGAWLGGYTLDPSAASVKVTFLSANGTSLGEAKLKEVGLFQRLFATKFIEETATGLLPTGTRSANVEVIFTDKNPIKYGFNAKYNDAFADNISFTIDAALPAPGAPVQPVVNPTMINSLDHVFMTYVENKGYNDILGSENAPFLNGLMQTYGFATNYYALTHGSLPNYYPINGGTNYGITYNCATVCIDDTSPSVKTLVKNIEAAGKTWKDYTLGLTPGQDPTVAAGDYAFDSSPFQAFKTIGGNLANAKAHIVPIEEMELDLVSNATTPNFVWFAPDEDSNGEGPVDGVSGAIKFALNQLDPKHQYNVPALDEFLSTYVTVIMDSPVWNDPAQRSAIVVTFDEDNNNTYLGFSKEGNHIVTVVIASPGAIAAGMKGGAFTSAQQYDHYGMLRTIEESLGLTSQYGYLTKNDEYAVPLNDFWNAP